METYLNFFLLMLQMVFLIINKKNIKWLIQSC